MKQIPLVLLSVLAIIVTVTGCGNDDTPTSGASAAGSLVVGYVLLRPYVDFSVSVFPVKGQDIPIDSALCGDSACRILQNYYSPIFGSPYVWNVLYYNPADSLRFQSGDSIDVTFFVGNVPTTTTLRLLSWNDDIPVLVGPPEDDTVDTGESFTLVWHKVDGADWYGIETYFFYDGSMFGSEYTVSYYSTTDTTLDIAGDSHDVDGQYWIRVVAVCGSFPGSGVYNVNGETLTGDIYSTSDISDPLNLIVGLGLPDFIEGKRSLPAVVDEVSTLVYRIVESKGVH